MAKYIVETASGKYQVETEDSGDTKTTLPEPSSLMGKITSGVTDIAKKTVMAPVQHETISKLENYGQQVKGAANAAISDAVSAPHTSGNENLRAGVGTAAQFAIDNAPFTPSEFAASIAPSMVGKAVSAPVNDMAQNIANRFARAPLAIAQKRFKDELPRVGESILERPQYLEGAGMGDKAQIVKNAESGIKTLAEKARTIINNSDAVININDRGTLDAMQNIAGTMLNAKMPFSLDQAEKGILRNVYLRTREGLPIDFKLANDFREVLGADIGKKFASNMDALPELTQGQRAVFGKLRSIIGAARPDLDGILTEQHNLHDIANSLTPAAAQGYEALPANGIAAAARVGGIKNIRVAQMLNSLSKERNIPIPDYIEKILFGEEEASAAGNSAKDIGPKFGSYQTSRTAQNLKRLPPAAKDLQNVIFEEGMQ